MKLPKVINHKNMAPLLEAIAHEPCYQPGSNTPITGDEWHQSLVWLEMPTGELARDPLASLALLGHDYWEATSITGEEGFQAQGLEGKIRVRKTLFSALMNLRDILPPRRGRIVTR